MRTFLLAHAALGSAFLIGQPRMARADFQLSLGQAPAHPSVSRGPDSVVAPGPDVDAATRPAVPMSRFRMAQGFGHSVSLAFAVRQIVPSAVPVRFGAGVDPASVVDWSGGQPWNRVLAAAVQPLGLRVVVGIGRVLIVR